MGADNEVDRAPCEIGSVEYRQRKAFEVIESHDDRIRRVVELAHRDNRSYASLTTLSVQLAHLLLKYTSLEEASSYDATSTTCPNPIATRRHSRSNNLASNTRNSKRHTYNLRARKINTG